MTQTAAQMLDAVVKLIRALAAEGGLPRDLATADLNEHTRLEQLALDSVGKMDLLSAVDERLSIYVPEDVVSPEMTLGALAEQVARRQG